MTKNELSIEEIMGKIKKDIETLKVKKTFNQIQNKFVYNIEDLLNFDDDDFVKNAYKILLGREADKDGLDISLEKLRNRVLTKKQIIESLYHCGESRNFKPNVFLSNQNSISPISFKTNMVYSMEELIKLDGEDFLKNAYKSILGRDVDVSGLKSGLDALKNGTLDKKDIIANLKNSEEGINLNNRILISEKKDYQFKDKNRIYWINELINGNNEEFIKNAYREILNREIDAEGLKTALSSLEQNTITRKNLISDLKNSSEGKTNNLKILFDLEKQPFYKKSVDSNIRNRKEFAISEFLSYDDVDFVVFLFNAILGRDPNDEEVKNYLSLLRSNFKNKIEIIEEIRFNSIEGKNRNVKIKGLYKKFLLRKIYKIPVIGYFLRICVLIVRLPKIFNNVEAFDVKLNADMNDLKNKIDFENEKVNKNFQELISCINQKPNNDIVDTLKWDMINATHDFNEIRGILNKKIDIIQFEELRKNINEITLDFKTLEDIFNNKIYNHIEEIYRIINNKANNQSIDELRNIVNNQINELKNLLDKKIEISIIDELKNIINNKPDFISIENAKNEVYQKINELSDIKTDKSFFETIKNELYQKVDELYDIKTDKTFFETIKNELYQKVDELYDIKTDKSFFETIKNELYQKTTELYDIKTDKTFFETIKNELYQKVDELYDMKADKYFLDTAKNELHQRVDELYNIKADKNFLEDSKNELYQKIGEVNDIKTDKSFFETVKTELYHKFDELKEIKADKYFLEATKSELIHKVDDLINSKTDKIFFESIKNDFNKKIEELYEIKTDKVFFESIKNGFSEKIEELYAIKTDKVFFNEAKDTLNKRVDEINDKKEDKNHVNYIKNELLKQIEELYAIKTDKVFFEDTKLELKNTITNNNNKLLSQTFDMQNQLTNNKLNLLEQQRRLTMFLEEARKRLPEPFSKEQIEKIVSEEEHLFDSMYVEFEDLFRGTREDIKGRVKYYLPFVEEVYKKTNKSPILDIGCGRGEWVELLKENNYNATGIDTNKIMVKRCKDLGLDVKEGDVIEYLRNQKDNSLSVITGFHVMEHLPFKVLIKLFDESLRVLKPGGMILFETPNPENINVGAYTFYYDPTHVKPLVPDTIRFIAEQRGFVNTNIIRLHKRNEVGTTGNNFVDEVVYKVNMEQDFSIVGYKI